MIVLILSIILIILAVLERIIYLKRNKKGNKVRLFIGVIMIGILFLISYFITDTAISLSYIFLWITISILIHIVIYRSNVSWLKYLSIAVGIPSIIYLMIKAFQNMLIRPNYIFMLLLITFLILSYSYKIKWAIKEKVLITIELLSIIAIIFFYFKSTDFEKRIMIKQELVAQEYLEEELDMKGLEVYIDNMDGSLRGEETIVNAYGQRKFFIKMIYKNNKIIRHEIKDS